MWLAGVISCPAGFGPCRGWGQVWVWKRVCTRGQWDWNRLPRAVSQPRVPEFGGVQIMLSDIGFGFGVWRQELNW